MSQEEQPAASSSAAPHLPFWLLAKDTSGTWQCLPLTAWARLSFAGLPSKHPVALKVD